MDGNLAITNISELATPTGFSARRGAEMRALHVVKDAAVIVENGLIAYAGPGAGPECGSALERARCRNAAFLDAKGRACVPGFVDSHTHFVFTGHREDEFFWRAEGLPYMEIHKRGGGIRRTMEATRAAPIEELLRSGRSRLDTMLSLGITTVEGKSGYGLDLDTELKQLETMKRLNLDHPIHIISTFMGAHSIPPEFDCRPSAYIDYVMAEVLPRVADRKLASFVDIFCEKGVFEIEDSRRFLMSAKKRGFGLKIHADEIERIGGAGLAAETGATSADHLLKAATKDLEKMAKAGVMATCLPLTAFSLMEPYADARAMIDRGLAVALASDFNPGSCYSQSLPMLFAIAVLYMKLSFAETLTAMTLNGAASLGLARETGSVEPGKAGDIVLLDAPSASYLAYNVGMNLVSMVVKDGDLVYQTPAETLPLVDTYNSRAMITPTKATSRALEGFSP